MKLPALVIDTSTRYLVAGRVEGSGPIKLSAVESISRGEDAVDGAIAELFPDLGEMKSLWLGQGPGSFVGLRSSFAYARMLVMLRQLDCQVFWSSLLWRQIFAVPRQAWFLSRTNAKLFYADRFTPDREAHAIEADAARSLDGDVFCLSDSWQPQPNGAAHQPAPTTIGTMLHMADARWSLPDSWLSQLALSQPLQHDALHPVYGHELHFKLAKGNQHG